MRHLRPPTVLIVSAAILLAFVQCAQTPQPAPASPSIMGPPVGPPAPGAGVTAPESSGMAPPTSIMAPTENIAKVVNALEIRARSLTTLVVVEPGLALTQPVTISISIGGYAPQRLTQSYVASTGNHFLHHDPEGDGNPRQGVVDITLSEPNPSGGDFSLTIPERVVLDPLYDVHISPLEFMLFTDCDWIGDSEIVLRWKTPDDKNQRASFSTSAGEHVSIGGFAWSRSEVSASRGKRKPALWVFKEEDVDWPFGYEPGVLPPPFVNLVPGTTHQVAWTISEITDQCSASVQYTITYLLRWYPFL